MSAPDHDRWADYAGAYVLGAVDEHESAGFEAHLGECERCRMEVEELRPVTSALAASVPPRDAPSDLLDRIMGTVRPEAELLRAAGADADRPPRRARRILWRPLTGAIAAGALAAAGVAGFVLGSDDTTAPKTLAAHVTIPAGSSASIVSPDHPELVVAHFPPSPAAHVYQVWLVARAGGAPQATKKLFVVGQDGSASVALPSLHGVRQVMVTAEGPTGSATGRPSGAPVLTATLL